MARGFVYLAAAVDWSSRRVLSHRLSNTMATGFCIEALEEALAKYGRPEIFNTDQGSQFTSEAFTGVLTWHGIAISHWIAERDPFGSLRMADRPCQASYANLGDGSIRQQAANSFIALFKFVRPALNLNCVLRLSHRSYGLENC